MAIELPPLPYSPEGLVPHLSAETFAYHYDEHHATYVATVNKLVAGTDHAEMTLDELVTSSDGTLFNQAAQVWNHNLYWRSLAPGGGGRPTGAAAAAVDRSFGSYDAFREQFQQAAVGQFGSGWVWLELASDGTLTITTTGNADTPLRSGRRAVLTCDVWEHAYYIDYRNRRADYVTAFLDHLLNWQLLTDTLGD